MGWMSYVMHTGGRVCLHPLWMSTLLMQHMRTIIQKKSLYIKWRCFADSCLYSAWCHADIFDADLKSDYINGINLMY